MATTLNIRRMSGLSSGSNNTSLPSPFFRDDVASGGGNVRIPGTGTGFSYTHVLRTFLSATTDTEISNLVWFTDGNNGWTAGVDAHAKNEGLTWSANVDTEMTGGASVFTFTSGAPLDGSVAQSGPWTPADVGSYIGDLIRLQLRVQAGTVAGALVAENFVMQVDVV